MGQGLADLFPRYAMASYHDDLWSGQMAPRLHRGQTALSAALMQSNEHNAAAFAAVTQARGGNVVVVPWELSVAPRLRHLTAWAFAMNVGPLEQKGKLVVRPQVTGGGNLQLWLASGTTGGSLPATGRNLGFQQITDPADPAAAHPRERDPRGRLHLQRGSGRADAPLHPRVELPSEAGRCGACGRCFARARPMRTVGGNRVYPS